MSGKITWKRPSGSLLTTNDLPETVAYCVSNDFERVDTVEEQEELDLEIDEDEDEDEDA